MTFYACPYGDCPTELQPYHGDPARGVQSHLIAVHNMAPAPALDYALANLKVTRR